MVAVLNSPLFANDFPLDTTSFTTANRAVLKHNQSKDQIGGGRQTTETVARLTRIPDYDPNITNLAFPRDLSGNGGPAFSRASS